MNLLYFWLRFSTDQMPLLGDQPRRHQHRSTERK